MKNSIVLMVTMIVGAIFMSGCLSTGIRSTQKQCPEGVINDKQVYFHVFGEPNRDFECARAAPQQRTIIQTPGPMGQAPMCAPAAHPAAYTRPNEEIHTDGNLYRFQGRDYVKVLEPNGESRFVEYHPGDYVAAENQAVRRSY